MTVGSARAHKLPINLSELKDALENASYEQLYVLDLETGMVLSTTIEETEEVDKIIAELEGAEGEIWTAFESALEREDFPDWRKESLRQAALIEAGFGTRYRRIDRDDPYADYRDMEDFIDTISDAALQSRLERTIRGRGAFRYFRDELLDHPTERERWFEFKSARLRERAFDWLRHEGIEPIAE